MKFRTVTESSTDPYYYVVPLAALAVGTAGGWQKIDLPLCLVRRRRQLVNWTARRVAAPGKW